MSITPTIRDFLVQLEDLLDRNPPAGLDRDAMTITTADAIALVRLPHVSDHDRDIEIEVDDHRVKVAYLPERVTFTSPDEALRFVEMLCAGRVELEISAARSGRRCAATATARPSRSGARACPWPSLRPRTERRRVGFGP